MAAKRRKRRKGILMKSQNEIFVFESPGNSDNSASLLLKLTQDSTGGRTVTWPDSVKWPNGTAPTLSTGAGAIDIISFYYDGTNYYGISSLDFN